MHPDNYICSGHFLQRNYFLIENYVLFHHCLPFLAACLHTLTFFIYGVSDKYVKVDSGLLSTSPFGLLSNSSRVFSLTTSFEFYQHLFKIFWEVLANRCSSLETKSISLHEPLKLDLVCFNLCSGMPCSFETFLALVRMISVVIERLVYFEFR